MEPAEVFRDWASNAALALYAGHNTIQKKHIALLSKLSLCDIFIRGVIV